MAERPTCPIPELTDAIAQRFWAHVERRPGGCMEWGAGTGMGYGRFKVAGRLYSAHRLAYELVNGPIAEGEWVLHRCDNRRCCNPEHLFLGDRSANMRDCAKKGRLVQQVNPERFIFTNPSRKLEPEQVREIRRTFAAGEATKAQLSRRFGVAHRTIRSILAGTTWKIAAAYPTA